MHAIERHLTSAAPRIPLPRAHTAIGFHLTMRLSDDRGVARCAASLRLAARVLIDQGEPRGLLAFRIADTHVHVLLAGSRAQAGHFARYSQGALRRRLALPVPFQPARVRPIASPAHLRNALRYLLRQEAHHGTDLDLAHDGSCLPDLLGMRHIGGGGARERLRRLLPRLTPQELRAWAGLPDSLDVSPDLDLLPDAAAAAFGLASLAGSSRRCELARCAAAHAAPITSDALAALLGVSRRAVQRARKTPVDGAQVRAVELQLCLRTALRAAAPRWP